MQNFYIKLRSFQEVQEFISMATVQPFAVLVGNEAQQVNGKSFMEMFCLHFANTLYAVVDCAEEQLQQLKSEMERFLA